MSKSYSNKALPAGTVLREWRLEEVLGVGGFGIVYKGRGIYFDELVAIKEYFPSAISERRDGDTVVPIDSNAEEVHALGLKKFVEEAKLLWNLSTPTRHPNIVSVRSLFEIHGTAYIVMDFEDGVSLSKLLKDGRRFNEASLTNWVVPIAEGLERAHRVGVLHRDIKPPNILINVDGRPVLIDFGSARFESADATSTTVTFHTPPYAAIEQYVKTYEQGPWTDIYALGVVLYECVTGEKPPEVLERLHGGLGTPLAGGNWPGYSRRFLEAVDAAMTIRPGDRPQSIAQWLAMFDESTAAPPAAVAEEPDEDATRIYIAPTASDVIVPVAPVPEGFAEPGKIDTAVPEDTSEVKFKLAGRETGHSVKQTPAALNVPPQAPSKGETASGKPAGKDAKGSKRPALIAAGGLGVLLLAGGGWFLANKNAAPEAALADAQSADAVPMASGSAAPVQIANGDDLAATIQALASDARRAGVSSKAATGIAFTAQKIAALRDGLAGLGSDAERAARTQEMSQLAKTGVAGFATALAGDAAGRAYRLGREAPWADPRNAGTAQAGKPDQQRAVRDLRAALAGLNAAAAQAQQAPDARTAIAAARQALSASNGFSQAYVRAARLNSAKAPQLAQSGAGAMIEAEAVGTQEPAAKPAENRSGGVSPAKQQQFNASVSTARSIAESVIRQSRSTRTTDAEKKRALEANVKAAQTYLSYLDNLTNSMRGAKSDSEADRMIGQAEQTRRYLMVLLSRST